MEFGISLLSFCYMGWGLGQLAAMIGILLGYAIPRAPTFFRLLICVPLFLSAISAMSITVIALTGQEKLMSLDGLDLLLISSGTQLLVWWTLVAYAVYFHLRGSHCGA